MVHCSSFRKLLNKLYYIGLIFIARLSVSPRIMYRKLLTDFLKITFSIRHHIIANRNNCSHLLSPLYVPDSLLNTLHILTYLLNTVNLCAVKHDL